MSDRKMPELLQEEKYIEIKPLTEIREKRTKASSDNSEQAKIHDQEKLQLARQELENIKDQKKQMIEEARATIAKEKEEWEQTKKTLTKQAHDEGFHAGIAAGKQEVMYQYQNLLQKANQIVESANEDYHSKLEQYESAIVDLAIHTAGKIMDKELRNEPSAILSIVRTAIREIKEQPTVTIHVHPDYHEIVSQQKQELTQLVHGDTILTIYADGELDKNGCVIEHPLGKIDASVDTQLQQLREVLHGIAMETDL